MFMGDFVADIWQLEEKSLASEKEAILHLKVKKTLSHNR
jgi:hypothetical protein